MLRCAIRRVDLRSLWRSCRFGGGYSRRGRDAVSSRQIKTSHTAELRNCGVANGNARASDPASESRLLQPHPRVVAGAIHRNAGPDREIVDEQDERGGDEHTRDESARVIGTGEEYQVADEYRADADCAGQRAEPEDEHRRHRKQDREMLPWLGAFVEELGEYRGECDVTEINRAHVMVEEQRAADPNPDDDVTEVADYQERARDARTLDGVYRGDGDRGQRAPPQQRISAAPNR